MNNLEIITLKKENITDFTKERNLLLAKSKAEWIFFLDSDEIAPPELMTEIRSLLTRRNLVNGYYIKRKIVFLGKEIGEDKVLRLAKRNEGKWTRTVHETWQVKGKIGILTNFIIHNTATNLSDYIEKINNYSSLHAIENRREGKRSNLLKIIIYPKLKFLQNLISGRGVVFSIMQSFHSFLGWAKLWELQKN